jgi:hypothetical protein
MDNIITGNIIIGNLVAHARRRFGRAHASPHRRGVAEPEIGSQRVAQMAAVDDDLRPGHVTPRCHREHQQGRIEVRILTESMLRDPGAKPVTRVIPDWARYAASRGQFWRTASPAARSAGLPPTAPTLNVPGTVTCDI